MATPPVYRSNAISVEVTESNVSWVRRYLYGTEYSHSTLAQEGRKWQWRI